MKYFHFVCMFLLLACLLVSAQNPVPLLNQPLIPATVAPGNGAFTLTINGSGFTSVAAVYWNGSLRSTTVVSGHQVQAQIAAEDVAKPGIASVTVANLGAGAVHSNVVYLPIRLPAKGIGFAPSPVENAIEDFGAVAVGDFDNDGLSDFAVVVPDGVQLFLGKGNGTFQPPILTTLKGISGIRILVSGDFNGDGKLDLAVAAQNPRCCSIYTFLGRGNGTFTKGESFHTKNRRYLVSPVAVADFNGDGKLDLFGDVFFHSQGFYQIMLGEGNGGFILGSASRVAKFGGLPAIADFNADGNLDFALAGSKPGPGVDVFLSQGGGNFAPRVTYRVAFHSTSVVAADVNGDEIVDLVTDGGSVLLGNGDGTFGKDTGRATGLSGAISVGDFNGDGLLDIAVGPSIFLGDGKGHFQKPLNFAGLNSGAPTSVAGFNADGDLDLLGFDAFDGELTISVQIPVYFTPTNLDFGELKEGTTSPPQTGSVTNFGTHNLAISGINITGTNAPDFSQTNNCGTSLPPKGTCKIQVTFTPSLVGPESASLNFSYKGAASLSMPLMGTGLPNNTFTVTLTPTNMTFPLSLIGTPSEAMAATLTNTGNQPVDISGIAATLPFTQTNSCPATLPVGGNCGIEVTFTAAHRGITNGTLSVTDNAVGSPQTIALSGTGTAVVIAPTGVDFGNQQVKTSSVPIPITLTNLDTTALPVTKIQITGTNSGDFQQMNDCGNSIPAQGKCTITVTFTPTAKGARSAQVSISDDDPTSPQTVPLSGKGT
jgi:hypothetical protein